MKVNKSWHGKNVLGSKASVGRRIDWHVRHQENCGCKEMPKSISKALEAKKMKICSRGHKFIGSDSCPVCWPGGLKKKQQKTAMNRKIQSYNAALAQEDKKICNLLMKEINRSLPLAESKVWHAHPVWFFDGNPVVGYSKLKDGVKLMFWSGTSFGEEKLEPGTGKFKDASILYTTAKQVNPADLKRWLKKAKGIQWDYKNIVKRKGRLVRLK